MIGLKPCGSLIGKRGRGCAHDEYAPYIFGSYGGGMLASIQYSQNVPNQPDQLQTPVWVC